MEWQPMLYIEGQERQQRLILDRLAKHIGTKAENLVFVPNATHGTNIVLRSILKKGDKVVSLNLAYGAVLISLRAMQEEIGCEVLLVDIELPLEPGKVDFLSHV